MAVGENVPGVGQNVQDQPGFSCVWEYQQPLPPRNNGGEATFFWKSDPNLDIPDLQASQAEFPLASAEAAARIDMPEFGLTWGAAVVRPQRRGHLSLHRPEPTRPVQ